MDRMRPLWSSSSPPSQGERKVLVSRFGAALRELGPANFLYCDGSTLFAHADRRRQSDGSISAPGLWRLARQCPAGGELSAEGLRIASEAGEQEVVLIASVPLSDEGWTPLAEGELLIARQGCVQRTSDPGH
ncbi:MAG: hypothetical protein A3G25_02985 [Betaproteobacteria bacterium RIFCSPLOWO2_12_FULL_63_13]|nr:MAG: hypothetical protein A3G25_02985 [Betaproteobacteria bacterium RIFCSPLOWO2_12_FULL_63_13]